MIPLGIWLWWKKKSEIHYPFLLENPGSGSGARAALFNWLLIGIMLYISSPFIKMAFTRTENKADITQTEKIINALNIDSIVNTEIDRQYSILKNQPKKEVLEVKPTAKPEIYHFLYSYYFPDLGGVNCHQDNWTGTNCRDVTASGKSWRNNLGKGVALHYDMIKLIPFFTKIRVLYPENMKGIYEVIDICPGCKINNNYYIDFLDTAQRLPWSEKIVVEVLR